MANPNNLYHPPSFKCMNCDEIIQWTRRIKLYCSDLCKAEADYVRYSRNCKKDGRINRPDVQETLKIMFAHIASGGYHEKERRISQEIREMVITRDKCLCRICGKPGNDIDHIDGDSNNLDNLQLLCRDCHNKKTISNIVLLKLGDERYFDLMGKRVQLDLRIDSEEPLYECDDEENWPTIYRQVIFDRKQTFYKSLFPIIKAFIKQKLGKRKIAEQLNRQNVPTFSGYGKWYKPTVKKIIDLINSS